MRRVKDDVKKGRETSWRRMKLNIEGNERAEGIEWKWMARRDERNVLLQEERKEKLYRRKRQDSR